MLPGVMFSTNLREKSSLVLCLDRERNEIKVH